jgi:hypothetical protein
MRDVEFVLSYYCGATVAQQLIVVQQTTRNRILDGEHADRRGILLDILKDLFEGRAANKLYLFPLEIQVCRNIVERPDQSLNGNSLHILTFSIFLKKTPLSPFREAEPYYILQILNLKFYLRPTASQLLAK